MDQQKERSVHLTEMEQLGLVRTIEAAIEVSHLNHFHAWLRGPFRHLIPHDCMVSVEIDGDGIFHHMDALHHGPCSSEKLETLCHPENGLAVRLVRLLAQTKAGVCICDAPALAGLNGGNPPHHGGPLNAVAYRTSFVSGSACYFVLFGVATGLEERCLYLIRLLSSHLKMAWSRVTERPGAIRAATGITEREQEILRWMQQGRSNQEISVLLAISPLTLKNHVRKIYRKLDVQNRAQAISRGLGIPLADEADDVSTR